jgi:hypothetical protein
MDTSHDPDRDDRPWRPAASGPSFVYVLPCLGEDLLKLGMSRDPLDRFQSLHPRWFDFFDLDSTFGRGNQGGHPTPAIERDAKIILFRDIHARRDDQHVHGHTFRPGLIADHAIHEHELGGVAGFIGAFHELHKPRFAPTAGIHLRLHHAQRLGEFLKRSGGLIGRADNFRRRDGDASFGKDLTGLKFVNLHGAMSLAQTCTSLKQVKHAQQSGHGRFVSE